MHYTDRGRCKILMTLFHESMGRKKLSIPIHLWKGDLWYYCLPRAGNAIAHEIAGFTLAEADIMGDAGMGKKIKALMEDLAIKFVERSRK